MSPCLGCSPVGCCTTSNLDSFKICWRVKVALRSLHHIALTKRNKTCLWTFSGQKMMGAFGVLVMLLEIIVVFDYGFVDVPGFHFRVCEPVMSINLELLVSPRQAFYGWFLSLTCELGITLLALHFLCCGASLRYRSLCLDFWLDSCHLHTVEQWDKWVNNCWLRVFA